MEDGNVMMSAFSPIQDCLLENFDFDAFLNWESPKATEPCAVTQQSQVRAPPAAKKRRSNGVAQGPIKRMKIQHSHICDVHPPPTPKPFVRCFGKRSRTGPSKGKRCERMVASFVSGQLPVCAQHRAQVNKMVRCEANLECGLPCNEIIPWKPHQYLFCEAHWWKGKCYIMELPVEIRLSIYRYLIPDQPVQARWNRTRNLRQDRASVSTAIFRANKTIHEEVTDLFYGQLTFHIDVTNEKYYNIAATPNIFMCYANQLEARPPALRTTLWRPTRQSVSASGIKDVFTPWHPLLPLRYFQRIRHFQINIKFDIPKTYPSASNRSQTAETILAEAERDLLTDYLHRLVERLVASSQATLSNLDISLYIRGISDDDILRANSEAIAHCQALINPIRRLRSRNARLVSIIRTGTGSQEINMLTENLKEEDSVNKFVQSCCAELTSSIMSRPRSLVLVQFGRLAEIISQMSQHPFWRETDREEMGILLSNGRSAREANDTKAMVLVFRDVFHKLNRYHSDHLDFIKQMKQSLETVQSKGK